MESVLDLRCTCYGYCMRWQLPLSALLPLPSCAGLPTGGGGGGGGGGVVGEEEEGGGGGGGRV